ncbi:MAG: hypothetical protein ACXVNO_05020 [Bacteroidia bacterium]
MLVTLTRTITFKDNVSGKIELVKKTMTEQEEEGDEDGDPDSEKDVDDYLNAPEIIDWTDYLIDPYLYNYTSHKYLCAFTSVTTPPPKI